MLNEKIFGILSVAFCVAQYTPYIATILTGKTKPHVFSWIIWTITEATAFTAQITHGAGPGAWAAGFNAIGSLTIVCLSLRSGEKNITRSDWLSFMIALVAIAMWYFTKNPLGTLILNILIDIAACYPTLRKAYHKPYEENVTSYAMATLRSFTSLFAMETFSLITAIYPVALTVINGVMVFMFVWRRHALKKP
jgi:hypothetical protein